MVTKTPAPFAKASLGSSQIVWIVSAVWAALFAALDWWRWISYHANGDFALFVQTIVSGFPSYHNTVEEVNHFAVHFSPVYALISPLVIATGSVVPLFIIPAVAGALVAPGIFLLARRLMPPNRALGLALVALLYPPLVGLIFGDPFENVFAPAATVWLLYAFEARRFWLVSVAALAALAIKEDQGLFLAVTGLFLAWRFRGDRRRVFFALGVTGLALLTFVGYFTILRPHIASAGWAPTRFYDWTAASRDVAPWNSPSRVSYLLEVFVPLLFIPFRSPMLLLAAAPFAELLASPYTILFTNGTHYAGVWIGYVLVAYVYGMADVRSPVRAKWYTGASIAICMLQLAFASPTHWRVHLSLPTGHDRSLSSILGALPRDAGISTYEEAYAHLGFFPNAAQGVRGRPSLIIIDSTRPTSHFVPVLERYVKAHPAYVKRLSDDGIEVFALRSDHY